MFTLDIDVDIQRRAAWSTPTSSPATTEGASGVPSAMSSSFSSPRSPTFHPAAILELYAEAEHARTANPAPVNNQVCVGRRCGCKRLVWTFAFIAACIWRGKEFAIMAFAFGKNALFLSFGFPTIMEGLICAAFFHILTRIWFVAQFVYFFKGSFLLLCAFVWFRKRAW
ncbi:hypothetical protein FS749_012089 [Ceratobasidium sp. UAMH 11750]|nr:hypothetical protein FS749_012089 [Ceratobasidium sp. UAMH 11750]